MKHLMQIGRALVLMCAAVTAHADAPNATRVDIAFDGFDVSGYGGPASLDFGASILLLDSAPDLAGGGPQSLVSQFAGPVTFTVDGDTSASAGWLQFELLNLSRGSSHSDIVLTAPFAGFAFPVFALNTQLSGIELHLIDDIGAAPFSTAHADLPATLTSFVDRTRLFMRVGGWGAGLGDMREHNELTANATLTATATRIYVPVPEPASVALLALGLGLIAWRRAAQR